MRTLSEKLLEKATSGCTLHIAGDLISHVERHEAVPFLVEPVRVLLVCAVGGLSRIGTAAIGQTPIGPKLGHSPSHYSEVLTLLPNGP
jgi:hypothetical protein